MEYFKTYKLNKFQWQFILTIDANVLEISSQDLILTLNKLLFDNILKICIISFIMIIND